MIKGSERVTDWVHQEGTVWRAEVPNALFGEVNPFAVEVDGDWLLHPASGGRRHLGDVYLDGRVALASVSASFMRRTNLIRHSDSTTEKRM